MPVASVPVGLVVGYSVGRSVADCHPGYEHGEHYEGCKKEGYGIDVGLATAAVVIAAGVTGGVMMLRDSAGDRRLYREWDKDCKPSNDSTPKPTKASLEFDGFTLVSDRNHCCQVGTGIRF